MTHDSLTGRSVLFHNPNEVPFGVFSSFASTPIWIAGRRYQTVEHWFQSMRAVAEEHEWIRSAATPEDARQRGQSVEPRRFWSEEKVPIMYRGIVAKVRQHPPIAHLLLETGDAEIHETSDDRFWGVRGHDWLGKLFSHVRHKLRDPASDGPLTGLFRGRFLNYETALAVRQVRGRGDAWLIHLIRYRDGQEPREVLRQIVTQGILRTSRQLNGYHAVCFSAAPLFFLEQRVFGSEAHFRSESSAHIYSPFGLAVSYDFGRELGIHPVLPLPTEVSSELPLYLRFLAQPYSPRDLLDYTHEDEWRTAHDLDIREGPFALVYPAGQSLQIKPIYGLRWTEVIRALD